MLALVTVLVTTIPSANATITGALVFPMTVVIALSALALSNSLGLIRHLRLDNITDTPSVQVLVSATARLVIVSASLVLKVKAALVLLAPTIALATASACTSKIFHSRQLLMT